MALATYLIRFLPPTIIRKQIKNRTIRLIFSYYMPYVTLSVMTFPAILSATETLISALAGLVAAVFFAWQGRSLFTVASAACIAVFIWEYFSG